MKCREWIRNGTSQSRGSMPRWRTWKSTWLNGPEQRKKGERVS